MNVNNIHFVDWRLGRIKMMNKLFRLRYLNVIINYLIIYTSYFVYQFIYVFFIINAHNVGW